MYVRKSLALLLCDAAVFDPQGKATLYGVFDRLSVKEFPARHPQFAVFWKIRLERPATLELRLVDPSENFETPWRDTVEVGDSSGAVIQGVCVLTATEFRQPGGYRVELWQDSSERIASTDLQVDQLAA